MLMIRLIEIHREVAIEKQIKKKEKL